MTEPHTTTPPDTPAGNATAADHGRREWMRGYLQGHEQGAATSTITASLIRQLQADAWNDGYDTGHANGTTDSRTDIAAAVTDLATRYADIDHAFRRAGATLRSQRITADIAAMEAYATAAHQRHGTTAWNGLDNGATLPSADWAPNTTSLAEQAQRATATAPRPASTTKQANIGGSEAA